MQQIEDKDGYVYFDLKQELSDMGLLDLLTDNMVDRLVSKAIEINFFLQGRMITSDGRVYFLEEIKYDILSRLVETIQNWLKLGFRSTI